MDVYVVFDKFRNEIINMYEKLEEAEYEMKNFNENNGMDDFIVKKALLVKSKKNKVKFNEEEVDNDEFDIDVFKNKYDTLENQLNLVKYNFNILKEEYINEIYTTTFIITTLFVFTVLMSILK